MLYDSYLLYSQSAHVLQPWYDNDEKEHGNPKETKDYKLQI